jgi:hypothetical protein
MRRIVAAEYLTLDGVTEDPGPAGSSNTVAGRFPTGTTSSRQSNQSCSLRATRSCSAPDL